MTNTCVYHINIHMTEEKHEHLQGVVFIRSHDPDYNYCYLLPQRYSIITPQSKCNCNQETTGQTTAISSAYLNQETMTSSSCRVIVERVLLLFCSLICLIFQCHNTKIIDERIIV